MKHTEEGYRLFTAKHLFLGQYQQPVTAVNIYIMHYILNNSRICDDILSKRPVLSYH